MIRLAQGGLAALLLAAPIEAQTMDHAMHDMPGMRMPARPAPPARRKPAARPAPARRAPDPHAGHDMTTMHAMPMASEPRAQEGSAAAAMPEMPATGPIAGTDLPPGDAPAPRAAADHLADRVYGAGAMAASRDLLRREHGGGTYGQLLFNLAELQAGGDKPGYRWDGEAWIGGDVDRLWLKSEGTGRFDEQLGNADAQLLFSHSIDPYFDFQAGLRHAFGPGPDRTYATVGVEGLAPYRFEVEGQLFLSTRGDLLARVETWYDQRITQFLVLQPRAEANLALQDVRENRIGSGLSELELGLRLRYDRTRQLGPYLGLSWQRSFGDTRRFARTAGDDAGGFSVVAGLRSWF